MAEDRRMKITGHILLGLLLILCDGCMSIATHYQRSINPEAPCPDAEVATSVYPGTLTDAVFVAAPLSPECPLVVMLLSPLFLVDLPLSLVADTLFLPFDILHRGPYPPVGRQLRVQRTEATRKRLEAEYNEAWKTGHNATERVRTAQKTANEPQEAIGAPAPQPQR